MLLVKEYITCEGRYSHVYRFHMRFISHMVCENKMNLSYFLLKSLIKMSRKVQKYPGSAKTSLDHHSLITTLVFDELYRNQIVEKVFLVIDASFDLKEDRERKNMHNKQKNSTGTTKKPSKK